MNNEESIVHFLYCPFTGLGLYGGFRGNRWLRNRIKVFKQFVVPSLQAQTNKNFKVWISFRYEEKYNPLVKELQEYMTTIPEFKTFFTFNGVCFYDDKFPPKEARAKLLGNLKNTIGEMYDQFDLNTHVLMTIQPSDDCYHKNAVLAIQQGFRENPQLQAIGFTKGYMMNYKTLELNEYNPKTNPPFYTIKFPKKAFDDALKHADYTALKHDVEGYPKGTPLPSHEFVGDCLNYGTIDERGFLVGCHTENISTHFNHPYKGAVVDKAELENFGLDKVEPLQISVSLRKKILHKLPHRVQRKLRYVFGERGWARVYEFLRN